MREEIEVLEDHADVGAAFQDVLFLEFIERLALPAVADEIAVD